MPHVVMRYRQAPFFAVPGIPVTGTAYCLSSPPPYFPTTLLPHAL